MNNHCQSISLYEGCGNRLLIVHLKNKFDKQNSVFRNKLCSLGLNYQADSILVLTGNPANSHSQGYHVTMDVFEPRGNDGDFPHLSGSWSTMCGNGVRVVTRYLIENEKISCLIKTGSGLRQVSILSDQQYKVSMGRFTKDKIFLKKYISDFSYQNIIPKKFFKEIFSGLNGDINDKGIIDGEPHLVYLFKKSNIKLEKLKKLANLYGKPVTTNLIFFPFGINANFVIQEKRINDKLFVKACTFERGVEYVTMSCGTGATVIGSYFLEKDHSLRSIIVRMPGGSMIIEKGTDNNYYLTGPANPL